MTHSEAEPSDALVVRRARPDDDLPAILGLACRTLGWVGGEDDERFFRWKHLKSPFGESPMWLALDRERVAGFRTFLRWQLRSPDGAVLAAVRAVDTATDPEYQGRGIFTRLTLGAIDELRAEGTDLIFNTPNTSSLPGYLKMGWSVVGRLPAAVMLTRAASALTLTTARKPASLWSIEIRVGERAADVFAERDAIASLLSTRPRARGLATVRTPELLAWRYGFESLRYRVVLGGSSPADGLAVFRLRRRGSAVEAVVCDVLTPGTDRHAARSLLRRVARLTGADYLIRLRRAPVSPGPFLRLPRVGPILTCRRLDGDRVPALRDWALSMGDVELF
jgi:GNAT superfamily N-acetyltransferase